jgi:hypothetical protein
MSNDVEIRIAATTDSSFEAVTKDAIAKLEAIAAASEAAGKSLASSGASLAQGASASGAAAAESATRAADAQAKAWKTANAEIVRAEDSLIRDVFSKRQNLAKDLLGIARQFVVSELESTAKYWTERELLALEGVEKEKTSEAGGFIQKLLFDQLGLSSTVASQAAETQAVATGVAAQTAAKSTGNSIGKAEQAATASATIANDARMAYSGTYAAVAQIPYVGPYLAPAAAAAAFAAVMAYDTISSAEGGQWRVGGAEQITALHKDEMVWPGWAAEGARSMISGFASGGFRVPDSIDRSSAAEHHWNYAPVIHGVSERDVMDELKNNAGEFLSFVRGLTRGGAMKFS